MKKFVSVSLILIFLPVLAFSQIFHESLVPEKNQSVVYVGSYDWGACVEKIVINAGKKIPPEEIDFKKFTVEQILYPKNSNVGMTKGALTILDAFTSDSYGNKIGEASTFLTILTDVHPEAENSNPFVSILLGSRFYHFYGYKISNKNLKISVTQLKGFVNSNVAKFKIDRYEEQNFTLQYASFIPNSEEKIPLILWFHGMGEGGSNPYEVLFGTKTTALATEEIQHHFENGIAILAPQCPTGWLESTEKGAFGKRYWTPIDKDAPVRKVKKPIKNLLNKFFASDDSESEKEEKMPFAAVSYYTEPVKNLLADFLKKHPEIDRERIYVCGCSAGGYMTMNMMIQNPELFAAAVPICEFYLDSKITNAQIKKLAEKPLWFVYASNDDSVNPEKNSIPTINRLKEAEAQNLHVSEFKNVVDSSGNYSNRDVDFDDEEFGLPYEYEGHYSWIYFFNDACTDGELHLFDWLSRQKL